MAQEVGSPDSHCEASEQVPVDPLPLPPQLLGERPPGFWGTGHTVFLAPKGASSPPLRRPPRPALLPVQFAMLGPNQSRPAPSVSDGSPPSFPKSASGGSSRLCDGPGPSPPGRPVLRGGGGASFRHRLPDHYPAPLSLQKKG